MIDSLAMQKIKRYFHYAVLVMVSALILQSAASGAAHVHAAPAESADSGSTTSVDPAKESKCGTRVLTFPMWYKGVVDSDCEIKITKLNDFWVIVMNFVEILIQLVAYVSAGYIIWGGFKYIKSEGDPSKISEAKSAIMNAVFGLVIALASVAIVEFLQGRIIQS